MRNSLVAGQAKQAILTPKIGPAITQLPLFLAVFWVNFLQLGLAEAR
jgi:hypothetical protein